MIKFRLLGQVFKKNKISRICLSLNWFSSSRFTMSKKEEEKQVKKVSVKGGASGEEDMIACKTPKVSAFVIFNLSYRLGTESPS